MKTVISFIVLVAGLYSVTGSITENENALEKMKDYLDYARHLSEAVDVLGFVRDIRSIETTVLPYKTRAKRSTGAKSIDISNLNKLITGYMPSLIAGNIDWCQLYKLCFDVSGKCSEIYPKLHKKLREVINTIFEFFTPLLETNKTFVNAAIYAKFQSQTAVNIVPTIKKIVNESGEAAIGMYKIFEGYTAHDIKKDYFVLKTVDEYFEKNTLKKFFEGVERILDSPELLGVIKEFIATDGSGATTKAPTDGSGATTQGTTDGSGSGSKGNSSTVKPGSAVMALGIVLLIAHMFHF